MVKSAESRDTPIANAEDPEVVVKDQAYYDAKRLEMKEFRVTFGWGHPHGPSPDSYHGHYTTIWAPSTNLASNVAIGRYNGQWAAIYLPDAWKDWSWVMDKSTELEVLQYDPDQVIPVYPTRDARFPDCVYGRELPSASRESGGPSKTTEGGET